jgi:pyruvate kinase
MRKTKIVCTIGPACDTQEKLEDLINAGMNVARLNMSHATHEYHANLIKNIRYVCEALGKPVGILMDLQGPKIRIGTLKHKVILQPGQQYILTTRDVAGDDKEVNVPFEDLPRDVAPGQTLLIDDGLLELNVIKILDTDIITTVVRGGELKDRKGINLPHTTIKSKSITEKDVEDLMFGLEQHVTMVAMSFVRTPQDVLDLRKIIEDKEADLPIIAKIEKHEGVRNIDGIIDVVQGIMVARGDLGIEIPMAEVPIVQKMIISKCNAKAIPVITATQMLDSMIRNPMPTRAEATDVANAVFDGTDALMLSGETAFGEYPIKAVETMARIAEYTEASSYYKHSIAAKTPKPSLSITDSVAFATTDAAHNLKAQAIITATQTGFSARKISKYKPQMPAYAVTNSKDVMDRLTLSYGIFPVYIGKPPNLDSLIEEAVNSCLSKGYIKNGDLVVITAGILTGIPGGTNIMKIHVVAKEVAQGMGIGRGVVKGIVKVIAAPSDFTGIADGDVIVIKEADIDRIEQIKKASAILSEEGGMTSFSAIIGREMNIPVIVGIKKATTRFKDGMKVTIDTASGLVYEGYINLPGD